MPYRNKHPKKQMGTGPDANGVDCHHFCQNSDPRRVILCKCRCRGERHGEAWVEKHGTREVLSYYQRLQARWERWDAASARRLGKLRVLTGGLKAAANMRR